MPQPYPVESTRSAPPRATRRRAARSAAFAAALTGLALLPSGAQASGGGAEAGVAIEPAAQPTATVRASRVSLPSARRRLVTAVQQRLHLEADGVYGPRSRAAVRRFQRRHHLRASGRLTTATVAALDVATADAATVTAPRGDAATVLAVIARCESGGDPTRVSPGGAYRGKYQFHRSTWKAIGGSGDPAAAPEAEQDQRAAALYAEQGVKPWPTCGRQAVAAR